MIEHVWTVLCKKSVIDNETNNLSIYDVLEQLSVDVRFRPQDINKVKEINLPFELELTSLWTNATQEKTNADLKVDFINPKGRLIKEFFQVMEFPEKMKRLRSRIKVNGITLDEDGDYLFRVSFKDKDSKSFRKVSEIPIQIEIKKAVDTNLSPAV